MILPEDKLDYVDRVWQDQVLCQGCVFSEIKDSIRVSERL